MECLEKGTEDMQVSLCMGSLSAAAQALQCNTAFASPAFPRLTQGPQECSCTWEGKDWSFCLWASLASSKAGAAAPGEL